MTLGLETHAMLTIEPQARHFQASEFAADLYKVATGSPDQSKDYAEPVEFFSRTYLTEGLRDLTSRMPWANSSSCRPWRRSRPRPRP